MRAWLMLLLVMPMGIAAAELPLIGKTMPPYPEGLREVGGICLADPGNPGAVCDHSIALLADASIDPGAAAVMRYVVAGRMQQRGHRESRIGMRLCVSQHRAFVRSCDQSFPDRERKAAHSLVIGRRPLW